MPKICHVSTAHPPFDTRIFRKECVSLASAGFDVTLVVPYDREETIDGVHMVPLRKPISGWDRRIVLARQAANTAQTVRADLYHFHDAELIPPMARLARTTKRPVIWDAHENYVASIRHHNQFVVPAVSALVSRWFDRMELRRCENEFAGVVTVTDRIAQRYNDRGIRVRVVGNYSDLSSIPHPPRVPRSSRPRLISSGAQFAARGVFEVADAFSLLRKEIDCQVAFWGNFIPQEISGVLQRRASGNGAYAKDVLVGGPFAWEKLVNELIPTGWAGCVLFDQRNANNASGLPNRLFEFWASAVPVIATAGTEVARVVEETGGGLVIEGNDPERIAGAFREIARDRDIVERMGAAGRRAVETRFNWSIAFDNLLSLYAEVGITPGDVKIESDS